MTKKMLQFVGVEQSMPEKRSANDRRQDFDEIYRDFAVQAAELQASRCSQCGVPYCQVHCPLNNNIPDWLKLVAENRMEEAYEVSAATNNMPEICGRICPQDRLCEGNCVIEQAGHGTVTIGSVEKHITETAFDNGWVKPVVPLAERDESVAIIGAGPAGMAAAEQLRKQGIQVTIYDRYDRAGGLLIYGIPGFKLEKHVVQRRQTYLEDSGVHFELNTEIGKDISFFELRAKHDAVLIATGVYKARDLTLPGSGHDNIVPALDYLTASNRVGLGDTVPAFADGSLNAAGKNVVVIGGGDTAMDCVRTAVRQGATAVSCVYRRDEANMPGSAREVANAKEEGVTFEWLAAPTGFDGGSENQVTALRAVRMQLSVADESGRQSVTPVADSQFTIKADLAIQALGFEPEDLPKAFGAKELPVSRWGTIKVSWRNMMTDLDGVFAAGDIVRGASLVVWGVRDGRDAAAGILDYLNAHSMPEAAE